MKNHQKEDVSRPEFASGSHSRRQFILQSMAGAATALVGGMALQANPKPEEPPTSLPAVEVEKTADGLWTNLRNSYDLPNDVIQLDHGYWGVMALPVLKSYLKQQSRINREGPTYGRQQFPSDIQQARKETARLLGVDPDEILFTRGATEALQTLIGGFNQLRPGDEALYSDHDYDAMQDAMDWLQARRGVTVRKINIPTNPDFEAILDCYRDALRSFPKVRLLLLTHVCHRNGLVLPIRELQAIASEHDVSTIVDAAHSIGQVDFNIKDLDAPFVGLSLHKWMGAPMGTGIMYIRKGHSASIDPHYRSIEDDSGSIHTRIHTGTTDFASMLTIPEAIRFYQSIPAQARHTRLRQLQELWTSAIRPHNPIEVLCATDPRLSTGMASFRLRDNRDPAAHAALVRALWEKQHIVTVTRNGLSSGVCIRVTPAPYTREDEILTFANLLKTLTS